MTDNIALIDLDGTVADYDSIMKSKLASLRGPAEPGIEHGPHIDARCELIKCQPGFWQSLPRLELGFQVVEELKSIGFDLHVLTKGPGKAPNAWTEKFLWCQQHLPDLSVNVCTEKSLVYGRVLVDDWPPYFEKWLTVRPRGLVVSVAQPWNADITDPRVLRYDGTNREELRRRLRMAYDRPGSGES